MARLCKKCGGEVGTEAQFCTHCGMPLEKEGSFREETVKEQKQEEKAEVLSFGQWLLVLFLMSIPVVNIILAIVWSISSAVNRNKRNFARAWLALTVIAMLISTVIAVVGAFFIINAPTPLPYEHHMEYSTPQEQFIDNFLMEIGEI